MKILKFGGTSLANTNQFILAANIIEKGMCQEQIAVVLSAPASVTNCLVSVIGKTLSNLVVLSDLYIIKNRFISILKGLNNLYLNLLYNEVKVLIDTEFSLIKRLLDNININGKYLSSIARIMCCGEKLSVFIMKALLQARGYKVSIINPVQKILANGGYLESIVDIPESVRRISDNIIPKDNIILMPGFIAGNKQKETVLLGRNSSDYSAAILAVCLKASRCEIWTDVDGIYTRDPRHVSDASLLKSISYREANKLSFFGAKILHPRTIYPIAQLNIPCIVKNITNPQSSGTTISN